MKVCLHQTYRQSPVTKTKTEGVGDCNNCTPDDKNKNCRKYCPVTKFETIEVE